MFPVYVHTRLYIECVRMCVWSVHMHPQDRAEGVRNPPAGILRTRPCL